MIVRELIMEEREQKVWYVLRVKTGTEKKVGKLLSELGIEVCVPTQKEIHQWSDRKKRVEVAIFRSYVFICIYGKDKHKLYISKNILGYLKMCGKECILRPEDVISIKKLEAFEEQVFITYEKLEMGQEVEILSGLFLGYRGFVKDAGEKKKVRIEIASLNCFAILTIVKSELRIVT